MKLVDKHCKELPKGTPALGDAEVQTNLAAVTGWRVEKGATGTPQLAKRFEFKDFSGAMAFVTRLALVAESEQHHPDFSVHYNRVDVASWTHSVGGLSENDFILAAKLDALGA
ncbi:MAG TPA: 4a-hydroxytetrahydrobiopterin dehydratase [Polyangia bacterium]|jgi:4a-hydroxytetrahydrobiopterin dehydratase